MKILIVEDDSLLALALEEQLQSAGHEIVGPVYEYSKALVLATEERPDLAIVDLEIANAEERTRLVWSLSGLFDIPSIVLTSSRPDVSKCGAAAVSILNKPFRLEDILPSVDLAAERLLTSVRREVRGRSRRAELLEPSGIHLP